MLNFFTKIFINQILTIMKNTKLEVGDRVMRLGPPGDYTTGRMGTIIELAKIDPRARVDWDGSPRTWVRLSALGKIS